MENEMNVPEGESIKSDNDFFEEREWIDNPIDHEEQENNTGFILANVKVKMKRMILTKKKRMILMMILTRKKKRMILKRMRTS